MKMVSTGSDAGLLVHGRGYFIVCRSVYLLSIGNMWIIVAGSLFEILYEDTDNGCMKTEALLLWMNDKCHERA
jgi:hypothetical protein